MDLAAQDEALGADGRVTARLADGVADAGGNARDLVAVLAAEAAPSLGGVLRDGLQGTERGYGGMPGADDFLRCLDALFADIYAGPDYEPLDGWLRPPAERAGKIRGERAAPYPSARAAGCLHDLVDPLVAELQGCGEFAQRWAAQVQPAHRPVKLGLGDLGSVVCIDEPPLCALCRRQ